MLAINKPDSRKVREMSFSHSQQLNADQPTKNRVFTRLIACGAMISGLLSFVLSFIFDHIDMGLLEMLAGSFAALVGVALGLLSLLLGSKDPKTCLLAVIGILTGVGWFIVAVWIYLALREMPIGPC